MANHPEQDRPNVITAGNTPSQLSRTVVNRGDRPLLPQDGPDTANGIDILLRLRVKFHNLPVEDRPPLESSVPNLEEDIVAKATAAPTLDFSQNRSAERVLKTPKRKRKPIAISVLEAEIRRSKKFKKVEWWGSGGRRQRCHRCGQKKYSPDHRCRNILNAQQVTPQATIGKSTSKTSGS